jgi:hypothetical protein
VSSRPEQPKSFSKNILSKAFTASAVSEALPCVVVAESETYHPAASRYAAPVGPAEP